MNSPALSNSKRSHLGHLANISSKHSRIVSFFLSFSTFDQSQRVAQSMRKKIKRKPANSGITAKSAWKKGLNQIFFHSHNLTFFTWYSVPKPWTTYDLRFIFFLLNWFLMKSGICIKTDRRYASLNLTSNLLWSSSLKATSPRPWPKQNVALYLFK